MMTSMNQARQVRVAALTGHGDVDRGAGRGAAAPDPKDSVARQIIAEVQALKRQPQSTLVLKQITAKLAELNKLYNDPKQLQPVEFRIAACLALDRRTDEVSLQVLETSASDREAEVRKAVASSLSARNGSRSCTILRKLLSDPNSDVRRTAAASSHGTNDPQLYEALKTCLSDRDEWVRMSASSSLARSPLAAQRANPLVAQIADPRPEQRATAARALTDSSDSSTIDALKNALEGESDGNVAKALIEALANAAHRNSQVRTTIVKHTLSRNTDVRAAAVRGLRAIPLEEVRAALEARLLDVDEWVRQAAASSLASINSMPGVSEQVLKLSEHSNPGVRKAAALALSAEQDPGAAARLKVLLEKDPDASVRAAAADSLSGFSRDSTVTSALCAALKDRSSDVRTTAARALRGHSAALVVPALQSVIEERDEWVARAIASSLSTFNQRPGVEDAVLTAALSPNARVRETAARALDRETDPRGIAALGELGRDPESAVRQAAAESLSGASGASAKILSDMGRKEPSADVRRAIASSLRGTHLPEALSLLEQYLSDRDEWVRRAAATSIAANESGRAIQDRVRAKL